jgi:chromosome segregation ATPase
MSDTESKSEIRRLAFQDPTGTAAKLIQCQAQLAQCEGEKTAAVKVYEDFKRGFEEARQQLTQTLTEWDMLKTLLSDARQERDGERAAANALNADLTLLGEQLAQAVRERDEYKQWYEGGQAAANAQGLICSNAEAITILGEERDRLMRTIEAQDETVLSHERDAAIERADKVKADHVALVALVQAWADTMQAYDDSTEYSHAKWQAWHKAEQALLEARRGME